MGCCQKKKQEKLIDKDDSKESEESIKNESNIKLKISDFVVITLLGEGSFGDVFLVRYINNNNIYAMKKLSKQKLKLKNQVEHTKNERNLMVKLNCPFLLNIKFAFQDESKLYLVSEFMQGGDLYYHLKKEKNFTDEKARFYIIEIILGLEFLHKNKIIYRDLKPENILLDSEGHIKISDFGISKILKDHNEKAFTMCGTPQYLAPEVIINKGYDNTVDWWSLGCLLYEMLTGNKPFNISKENKINPKVYEEKIDYPEDMNSIAVNLIKKLLVVNPKQRLGYGDNDAKKIKNHKYFEGVDWDKYYNKDIEPPFIPDLNGETDLKYFETFYNDENSFSNRPTIISKSRQTEFNDFTYVTHSLENDPNKNIGTKSTIEEET